MYCFFFSLIGLISFFELGTSTFFITLEPGVRQCFFEELTNGGRIGINYEMNPEVNENKLLDFEIFGPNGQSLFVSKGESFGTYQFHAVLNGKHYYCFQSPYHGKVQFNLLGKSASPDANDPNKDNDGISFIKL